MLNTDITFSVQHPIVHLDERQQEIGRLFNRLFQLYSEDNRSRLTENIRRVFVQAAVFELLNWLENSIEEPEEEPKKGRLEILFRDFVKLLRDTKGRQREVRWFAAMLMMQLWLVRKQMESLFGGLFFLT